MRAENDGNIVRKDFIPSEREAIGAAIEARMLSEALLDAEVRLGELMKQIPKNSVLTITKLNALKPWLTIRTLWNR